MDGLGAGGRGKIRISARLSRDDACFGGAGPEQCLRASEKLKASLVPDMVPLDCCASQWPTIPPTLDTGQSCRPGFKDKHPSRSEHQVVHIIPPKRALHRRAMASRRRKPAGLPGRPLCLFFLLT